MFVTEKDFESLKETVFAAGKAILEVYSKADQGIEIKDDDSPVTEADLESNRIINEGLLSLEKQYPIVSEENDAWLPEDRAALKTSWLIDPLDGTKEFINKNGEFAICVALIHEGSPVIGIVYAPVVNQFFYARKGRGAFLQIGDELYPIEADELSLKSSNLRVGISRSHLNEQNDSYIQQFKNPILIPRGSILKITDIACGQLDMYPRVDSKTSEWDIAAGHIILEEAGGQVLDLATNEPLKYNKISLKNPPFIAIGILDD